MKELELKQELELELKLELPSHPCKRHHATLSGRLFAENLAIPRLLMAVAGDSSLLLTNCRPVPSGAGFKSCLPLFYD